MVKAKDEVLRPTFYDDTRHIWQKEQETKAVRQGVDPEDSALHTLRTMDGWHILKEHIDGLKHDLDVKMAEAVAKGMSESEIGKSAVMVVLSKDLLDSIINKVEASYDEVERIKSEPGDNTDE